MVFQDRSRQITDISSSISREIQLLSEIKCRYIIRKKVLKGCNKLCIKMFLKIASWWPRWKHSIQVLVWRYGEMCMLKCSSYIIITNSVTYLIENVIWPQCNSCYSLFPLTYYWLKMIVKIATYQYSNIPYFFKFCFILIWYKVFHFNSANIVNHIFSLTKI